MRSYTLTSVWGIPIKVDTSLLLFLPLLVWLIGSGGMIEAYGSFVNGFAPTAIDVESLTTGLTPWVIGLTVAVGLFVSVTVHELGHSWVARRYGVHIESITLWIFGGVAGMATIPREWYKEFWIAVAGPVTSVLLAGGFYLLVQFVPPVSDLVVFNLGSLVAVNLTLAAFNLLPAFPMDGGRIFRALLARSGDYVRATRTAARVGAVFALLMVVVGVLSRSITLILVAVFVYLAATTESKMVVYTSLLEGIDVGDLARTAPEPMSAETPVDRGVERMISEQYASYPVVDGAGSLVGTVSPDDLRTVSPAAWAETTVREVASDEAQTLPATTDAADLLSVFSRDGVSEVFVEEAGEIVGSVTTADLVETLTLLEGTESSRKPLVGRV